MSIYIHPHRYLMRTITMLMATVHCDELRRKDADMFQDGHDCVTIERVEWRRETSYARAARSYQDLDFDLACVNVRQ